MLGCNGVMTPQEVMFNTDKLFRPVKWTILQYRMFSSLAPIYPK